MIAQYMLFGEDIYPNFISYHTDIFESSNFSKSQTPKCHSDASNKFSVPKSYLIRFLSRSKKRKILKRGLHINLHSTTH